MQELVSEYDSPRSLQGTAFPVPERERLELRGLLPKKCLTMQAQVSPPSSLQKVPVALPFPALVWLRYKPVQRAVWIPE